MKPGSGTLSWEFEKETSVSSHSGLKIPKRINGFSSARFEWEVMSLSFAQLKVGDKNERLYLWQR